ncbi:MAG: pentapeptide repeat-containing protein [Phycisphaeraceae bacterium]|nr:pentapeptide repeat-containing protein [Phycisphaeraceae bacterium]
MKRQTSWVRSLWLMVGLIANSAGADIYQWEWIDPAHPELGKQQSATLCPDGAGVSATPGANLGSLNLTKGYLLNVNLGGASLSYTTLGTADLSQSDLSNVYGFRANLSSATLVGANLTNANFTEVSASGANFSGADLTNANFSSGGMFVFTSLNNANLSNTTLAGADFMYADVTGANFTDAEITGAHLNGLTGFSAAQLQSTASYKRYDLTYIDFEGTSLGGVNLSGQNLSHSNLSGGLAGVNLGNALITYAGVNGITSTQLYATASYAQHDLQGIRVYSGTMTGWDFSGQNLTSADFGTANLSNANFAGANLTGVKMVTVTGANFTNAQITGLDFGSGSTTTGLTPAQLISTANYAQHDLHGINFARALFDGLDLSGQNLTGVKAQYATLTNVDFSGADLTNADFYYGDVTGSDFTNATITGVSLPATHFTVDQLYSTASYAGHNLQGVYFCDILTGANLSNQNLTNAILRSSTLIDANLNGANLSNTDLHRTNFTNATFVNTEIAGADLSEAVGFTPDQLYATANYQRGDLSGISFYKLNLTGCDFRGQTLLDTSFGSTNLTNANFTETDLSALNLTGTLTGAIFTNANVTHTFFGSSLTAAQLYTTMNYQHHDLFGITLRSVTMVGADFAKLNLTDADLAGSYNTRGNLTGANFTGADLAGASLNYNDLTNANFSGANLTNASLGSFVVATNMNLTGADARGAKSMPNLSTATTTNLIRTDGTIQGLNLTGDKTLLVRDYDGDPERSLAPIAITVQTALTMDATSVLALLFEADAWDSTISFTSGIPVQLAGLLKLDLVAGLDPAGQVGRTFTLFNWTGVTPSGTMAIDSPYRWDLANLYTTGQATFLGAWLRGDFDGNGVLTLSDINPFKLALTDLAAWQAQNPGIPLSYVDPNGDGVVTLSDIPDFQAALAGGASSEVPEPAIAAVLLLGAIGLVRRR